MKHVIEKWSYHLPSDHTQLTQLVTEVLEETLKLQSGEVINGTLKGVIDPDRIIIVKEKLKDRK